MKIRPWVRWAGSNASGAGSGVSSNLRLRTYSFSDIAVERIPGAGLLHHEMMASNKPNVRAVLPDIWALMRPRRRLLGFGLVLMAINRSSGLVLPASTKYLIDDVIGKKNTEMLLPLMTAVVVATLIQGATSFALT